MVNSTGDKDVQANSEDLKKVENDSYFVLYFTSPVKIDTMLL